MKVLSLNMQTIVLYVVSLAYIVAGEHQNSNDREEVELAVIAVWDPFNAHSMDAGNWELVDGSDEFVSHRQSFHDGVFRYHYRLKEPSFDKIEVPKSKYNSRKSGSTQTKKVHVENCTMAYEGIYFDPSCMPITQYQDYDVMPFTSFQSRWPHEAGMSHYQCTAPICETEVDLTDDPPTGNRECNLECRWVKNYKNKMEDRRLDDHKCGPIVHCNGIIDSMTIWYYGKPEESSSSSEARCGLGRVFC